MIPPGHVCVGGCQAHTAISPQPPSEVAEHVTDHGANGPEVVVAVGGRTIEEMDPSVVRSHCWCCMEFTRDVAAWLG